jgi:hypothetical protein
MPNLGYGAIINFLSVECRFDAMRKMTTNGCSGLQYPLDNWGYVRVLLGDLCGICC